MVIYLFSQILKFTQYSIKLIEKLSRRHLINSFDVRLIYGLTVGNSTWELLNKFLFLLFYQCFNFQFILIISAYNIRYRLIFVWLVFLFVSKKNVQIGNIWTDHGSNFLCFGTSHDPRAGIWSAKKSFQYSSKPHFRAKNKKNKGANIFYLFSVCMNTVAWSNLFKIERNRIIKNCFHTK